MAERRVEPWHDMPKCPACHAPTGAHVDGRHLQCLACGHMWTGDPAELDKARAADAAWEAELERLEEGARLERQAAEERRKFQLAKKGKLW